MIYMGSKNKHSKDLVRIINNFLPGCSAYVEPFCGGCNIVDKVAGIPRIANDIHYYLIEMWYELLDGWDPPRKISEKFYDEVKLNKDAYDPWLVGYVGFCSFGGKWFGGYRRDSIGLRDYGLDYYKNVTKQVPNLLGVEFINSNYANMRIPDGSLVYCDPPYQGTTSYENKFDQKAFWEWCRLIGRSNTVLVSEYVAPDDFICIWEKEVTDRMRIGVSKKEKEKLFLLTSV